MLIVPGLSWPRSQIDRLVDWQQRGHELVGHGWQHVAQRQRSLGHRFHSFWLSANVAEHLSKPPLELKNLVKRCFQWFIDNDLPAPQSYVPPAWALGKLRRDDLAELPFRFYEALCGFYDSETDRFHPASLIGFEASRRFRATALRFSNFANFELSRWFGVPLRFSIHPNDLRLRLGHLLRRRVESMARAPFEGRFDTPASWLKSMTEKGVASQSWQKQSTG